MARRSLSPAAVCSLLAVTAAFGWAALPAAAAQLYLATLKPVPGITDSLGYGSATLMVAADQKSATLHFSYSNLTTPKVSEHIHGPLNGINPTGIIFDIDKPAAPSPAIQPLPDGSYQWVFDTNQEPIGPLGPGNNTFLDDLAAGKLYMNVHTSKYPGGEIKGYFGVATGSQTFTPPAAPPAITINPPTSFDASRFLRQAAFGGTLAEITALSNANAPNASTALNDWLTMQFASAPPIAFNPPSMEQPAYAAAATPAGASFSPSSMYQTIYPHITTPQAPNAYADAMNTDRVTEAWWGNVLSGQDQLRQRIATAYSEIWVVSEIDSNLANNVPGLATYYDMLADDAFVNFRQLLGEITLHPVMGDYLNMMGNAYSTAHSPNENYAREVMQLFSIGLYQLQPDGTLKLDATGSPIPTYDQTTITNMAHVFTGWNRNATPLVIPTFPAPIAPATQPTVINFSSYYQKPMVITTASQHSPKAKQLLSYTGAKLWAGGATLQPTDPVIIPASTPSLTSAATELNFALDNIFNHPNVGPFVCKLLIQRSGEQQPQPRLMCIGWPRSSMTTAPPSSRQHAGGHYRHPDRLRSPQSEHHHNRSDRRANAGTADPAREHSAAAASHLCQREVEDRQYHQHFEPDHSAIPHGLQFLLTRLCAGRFDRGRRRCVAGIRDHLRDYDQQRSEHDLHRDLQSQLCQQTAHRNRMARGQLWQRRLSPP